MAEFAMLIIKMLVHLANGLIFLVQLGPRAMDALSRRMWSKAERIDSGSYLESHAVQLAFDSHGNAMAVSNEYRSVYARYFTPTTGWGKAEIIDNSRSDSLNGNSPAGKNNPQITFDTHGNAHAVWIQDTGYDEIMGYMQETWSNRYNAGVGWGQAERFEHTPGETRPVKIACDTQGNALAVWAHIVNNSSTLWAKYFKPDTGLLQVLAVLQRSCSLHSLPTAMRYCSGEPTNRARIPAGSSVFMPSITLPRQAGAK